jgi:DNA-binding transcriptional ArsR family regulator
MTDRMAALSDSTRREILRIVSEGPSSVADIARCLPVSRPAVSQHLRVLQDAGLVKHEVSGTRHLYKLDPTGVAALRDYFDSLWHVALAQFKTEAERPAAKRKEKRR